MAAEVVFSISASPIIHSQLVLPTREVPPVALIEDWESLWARVNRICDQYMPQIVENMWRIVGDKVDR